MKVRMRGSIPRSRMSLTMSEFIDRIEVHERDRKGSVQTTQKRVKALRDG